MKLHATMKFLYSYAEKMSINMRLRESKELQRTIDKWKVAEEEEPNEGKFSKLFLTLITLIK